MKKKIYQEEKDSYYSTGGKSYQLNILFELTDEQKPVEMKVNLFTWILPFTTVEESRIKRADLNTPILVYFDFAYKKWVVIDGAHRLTKAVDEKHKTILCKIVSEEMLEQALVQNNKNNNKPLFTKW